MGFATFLPFTADEHLRFIEALERIDPDAACSGREWANIASYVGGQRSVNEVKLHAHNYFLRLQAKCASSAHAHVCAVDESASQTLWTASEDAVFEQSLAIYDEGDEKRWEKIAAHLPEKSPDDVRRRYEQLILDVARIEAGEDVVLRYRAEDNNEDAATHQCARMQEDHHSQPDAPGRGGTGEQSTAGSSVKRSMSDTAGRHVIRPLPQRGLTAEGGQRMCGGQTYRHAQQQQPDHHGTNHHYPQQHSHPPSQLRQQQQDETEQQEPPLSPGPEHDPSLSVGLNGDARGGGGVEGFAPHQQHHSSVQDLWPPTPPLTSHGPTGHNAAGSMQHTQPQAHVCGARGSLMVVDGDGKEDHGVESFAAQPQQQQRQHHVYQEPQAYAHHQQKEGEDDGAHHEPRQHYMMQQQQKQQQQQQPQQFMDGPLIVTEDCAAFVGMDFGGDGADVGQGMHDFISHLHGSPPPLQHHHHNHHHIQSNDHHQELRHQHSHSHEPLDVLQPHPPPPQDYQQQQSHSHDKMGAHDPTGFEDHQQPTPESAVPPGHPELLSRFSDPGMYSAGGDSHAQHTHAPLPLPSPPSLTSDRPLTLATIMTDLPSATTATESTAVSPFSSSAMLPLTPSGHDLAADLVAGLAAALAGSGGEGVVCAPTDVHAFDAQTQTMECGGGAGGAEREAGGSQAHAHTHDAQEYGHDAVLRLPQRGETAASVQSHGDICVLGGAHDELCLGIDVDMSDAAYLLTQSGRNSVADGVMYAAACTAGGRGGGCGDAYASVHGICMDTVTAAGGCGAAAGAAAGDDHGGGGDGGGGGGSGGDVGFSDAARGGKEDESDMHDGNRSSGCTSTSPLSTSDDAMSLSSHASATTSRMPAAVHTHAHAPTTAEEQKAFLAALAAHVGVSTEPPQLAATATAK